MGNRIRVAAFGTLMLVPLAQAQVEDSKAIEPAVTTPSEAQDAAAPDATELETITVTGTREQGYRPTVAPGTIKSDTPLKEAPVSIQVVTHELIEDRGVQNYGEAVRTVPGISPHIGFGGINFRYTIRGFAAESNLKNGYRRATFIPIEELANIEQIEVLKGPASSLYGRFEPGGAVNLVTKRPQRESAHRFDVSAGRYDFFRTTLDSTGPLGEKLAYRVNAAFERADSFRDFVDHESVFIAPVLLFKASEATTVVLDLEYLDRKGSFDRGFGNNALFLTAPISRNFGERDTTGDNTSSSALLEVNHRFSADWRARLGFGFSEGEQESFGYNFGFPPIAGADTEMPVVNRRPFFSDETDRTSTLLAELYGRVEWLGIEHQLLFGVEGSRETAEADSGRLPNLPIDFFNPQYGNLSTETFSLLPGETRDDAAAVYVQDELRFGQHWRLLLGLRHDRVDVEFFDKEFIGPETFKRSDSATSPRVGLTWTPVTQASIYAAYAESFKTEQNTLIAPGTVPEPSRGEQSEFGVKMSFLDGRITPTLARFDIKRKDGVVPDPDDPDFRFSLQIGEQRSTGWELDLPAVITPQWRVLASYLDMDARVTEGTSIPAGRRLRNAPERAASLWTSYDWRLASGQLSLGAGLSYLDDRAANATNTLEIPSYTRYDANLAYRTKWSGHDLKLQLNALNLTDKVYYDQGGFTPFYPGAPRTWTATIALDL